MRNPFKTLGMTTAFVNSLKHKPDILRKTAHQNWKDLQKVFHPDIYGDDYHSIELNKAMDALDNELELQDYVESYISLPDSEKITAREKRLIEQNTTLEKRIELLRQHIVEEQENSNKKDKALTLFEKIITAKDNLSGLFVISVMPANVITLLTGRLNRNKHRFISTSSKYSLILRHGKKKTLCIVDGKTRCYRLTEYVNKAKVTSYRIPKDDKYLLGCSVTENFPSEQIVRRAELQPILGKIAPYFIIGRDVMCVAYSKSIKKYILLNIGKLERVVPQKTKVH